MGQKQIICLARVIAQKQKFLLIDEGTSNIDPKTDVRIQKVLQQQMKNVTILTIAHRLNTIIHYDRIFVFDKGKIVERGSPKDLMTRMSLFRELVMENGNDYYQQLMKYLVDKNMS